MSIYDEKNPGRNLTGTVYELAGTRGGGGVFGNLYEVVVRDIIFDEWNKQGLVLGEGRFGMEPQPQLDPKTYCWVNKNFACSHGFYLIIKDHKHWGLFLPKGTPTACVEAALQWLRLYGEKPVIDDDNPGTYHYELVEFNGMTMDAQRKVKN